MSSLVNIKIPVIVKKLNLSGYSNDPDFEDVSVRVWVNPPQSILDEYAEVQADFRKLQEKYRPSTSKMVNKAVFSKRRVERLQKETKELNKRFYVWFSKILSKHQNEDTHISAIELEKWHEAVNEADPALWKWLTTSAESMIIAHRNNLKNP